MNKASLLDRFLEPVGDILTPDVAKKLVALRADSQTQARLDELAEKANEGQLSSEEANEYDTYVAAIDFISVLQAKARTVLDKNVA